jgi:AdoMet-dependent heme synthase
MNDTTRPGLMQEVFTRCSRLSIPAQAILELTYRCNLHCVHCYVDVKEPEELSLEEWKAVIDQLKAAGTMFLLITGGEATLREDFLDIVAYARRSSFIVRVMTNCTLVTPEFARKLAALKPNSVATSLYGATAATHESVTRVPGSFEKTLRGISWLVCHGLKPLVQTVVMKSNVHELNDIKSLVESLGADSSIDIGIGPTKTGADFPFLCEPGVEELLACGWRPSQLVDKHSDGKGLCRAGKALCSVSPSGNVQPCVMFPLKLGNLKQTSFNKMWSLETCAELRYLRSMRRTDLHACDQCHLGAYCMRCTGAVYLETGRSDGPSPSACRQAQTRWRLNLAMEVKPCINRPT